MPSPVAHSLAGLAIAHAARTQKWIPAHWMWVVVLVVAANAADVDFVADSMDVGGWFFEHHGITHSVIAALVAGTVATLACAAVGMARAGLAGLIVGVAYLSHVVFDFSAGTVGFPTDMPLFWPLADAGVSTPVQLFAELHYDDQANSLMAFIMSTWHRDNALVVAREVLVVGGMVAFVRLAGYLRSRVVPLREGTS